jgi:hypothetical protein
MAALAIARSPQLPLVALPLAARHRPLLSELRDPSLRFGICPRFRSLEPPWICAPLVKQGRLWFVDSVPHTASPRLVSSLTPRPGAPSSAWASVRRSFAPHREGKKRLSVDSIFCVDAGHNPGIHRESKETARKKSLAPLSTPIVHALMETNVTSCPSLALIILFSITYVLKYNF